MNRRRGKPFSKTQLARHVRKEKIWAIVDERGWYSSRFSFEMAWRIGDFCSWEADEIARAEFEGRHQRELRLFQ